MEHTFFKPIDVASRNVEKSFPTRSSPRGICLDPRPGTRASFADHNAHLKRQGTGYCASEEDMELLVAQPLDDPEIGFGLQQAVLEEVAAGKRGPAALIWTTSGPRVRRRGATASCQLRRRPRSSAFPCWCATPAGGPSRRTGARSRSL